MRFFEFKSVELVHIDRTDSVPRLTGLLTHKSDKTYGCIEYWLTKWLNAPELADASLRNAIAEELSALHYGAASEKISSLRFRGALYDMKRLNGLGFSYIEIFLTLAFRAALKVSRTLHINPR